MNTYRKTAVTVGMLFIVGTVSGIMAGVFTLPIMEDPSFPLNISANQNDWIIGTLLISLMGFSLAMVPVLLYPILKNYNKALALGAVLFRGAIEAISYAVMLICNFLLLTISEMAGSASAAEHSIMQPVGSLIAAAKDWTEMWGALVFSIGALFMYIVFYQSRLVPRWLSIWGVLGAIPYFAANIASMITFPHTAPSVDSGIGQLMVPLAIQEMVFAGWLIIKGFNQSAMRSSTASWADSVEMN